MWEWRTEMADVEKENIRVLKERARAAREIGRLKGNTDMPIYEPDRERVIHENVRRENKGPLPDLEVKHIYERIIDVMRKLQKEEIQPHPKASGGSTEFDLEVNE